MVIRTLVKKNLFIIKHYHWSCKHFNIAKITSVNDFINLIFVLITIYL